MPNCLTTNLCIRCSQTDVAFQSYFTRADVLTLTLSDEVRGKPDIALITDKPLGNSWPLPALTNYEILWVSIVEKIRMKCRPYKVFFLLFECQTNIFVQEKLIKEIWKNIACQASLVLEGFSGFYFFSPYYWVRPKVSRGCGSWRWRQENLSSCIQPLLTRGARWKYCQMKIIPEENVAGWKCCWMKILPVEMSPDENIAFELFLGSRLDLSHQGYVRWCREILLSQS